MCPLGGECGHELILDLPPIGEVTDALAVAKKTDGMLLVVRQNYCDRLALADTVRQFEFVEARILGLVYNSTSDGSGKGYYKKYYGRYGKKYYGYGTYKRKENTVICNGVCLFKIFLAKTS